MRRGGGFVGASESPAPGVPVANGGSVEPVGAEHRGGPPFGGVWAPLLGSAAAVRALPGDGGVKWTAWQRLGGNGAHAPFNVCQQRSAELREAEIAGSQTAEREEMGEKRVKRVKACLPASLLHSTLPGLQRGGRNG